VILAAGLDGIANGLDAGEPNSENLYAIPFEELQARGLQTLPTNLLQATEELEQDDVIRQALGRARNEDYADYFIRVKREEWNRYHEQVTPWEIREYLTRF
jgi:glutamine synthetase